MQTINWFTRWSCGLLAVSCWQGNGVAQDTLKLPRSQATVVASEVLYIPSGQTQEQELPLDLSKGGKLIIVDKDGKRQEIDLTGAGKVTVMQTQESRSVNGQPTQTQTLGRAIIVGPDGTSREIEFVPSGGQGEFLNLRVGSEEGTVESAATLLEGNAALLAGDKVQYLFQGVSGKFFIGVSCEPANETLISQLQLSDASALVVTSVTADSPAAQAGLQTHDILLSANERPLASVPDLSEVVNTAGSEKQELQLTLLRGGKKQTVTLAPAERPTLNPGQDFQQLAESLSQFRVSGQQLADPQIVERAIQLYQVPADRSAGEDAEGTPTVDRFAWLADVKPAVIRGQMELSQTAMEELKSQLTQMREEFEKSRGELQNLQSVREELQKVIEEMKKFQREFRMEMRGGKSDQ